MALKIKLKPHEKAIINGAVIQNGPRATEIIVQNFAQLLREAEVMQESEADTPAKRTYFTAQLMLMDPQNKSEYEPAFERYCAELQNALINPAVKARLAEALEAANSGNYYAALKAIKDVIAYESLVLRPPGVVDLPDQD